MVADSKSASSSVFVVGKKQVLRFAQDDNLYLDNLYLDDNFILDDKFKWALALREDFN